MIKFIFLIVFLLTGPSALKAAQAPGDDQDFTAQLEGVKSPFEDGLPKPVPIVLPPVQAVQPQAQQPVVAPPPPVVVPVKLPDMHLQGVIVGDDVHDAIIDDDVVHLNGFVKEAQVITIDKQGVGLLYKDKKFFLKIDEPIIEDKNNV